MAQSNHQPFEDWIFSRDAISREDELMLRDHLQHCPDCQSLSGALQKVEFSLNAEPVLSPPPGFSNRWLERLAEHRLRKQKVQTIRFFLITFTIASVLTILFAILLQPAIRTPFPYLLAVAYQLASILVYMNRFASAGITIYRTLFKLIPPVMWVSLVIGLAASAIIWIAALRKLVYPRRITS